MFQLRVLSRFTLPLFVLSLFAVLPAATQQPTVPRVSNEPTLQPIAETKLLMEGLAHPNFLGLERLLSKQPQNVQEWTFARGQALLIAETGNLLMLRPPQGAGQNVWFDHAAKLRDTSSQLAHAAAKQDFAKSRSLLVGIANRCNGCHTSFRVKKEIVPFARK